MPWMQRSITIPANTLAAAPLERRYDLHYGVLCDMGVRFWSGCFGNVGVKLYHHEFQISPLNYDEWMVGDDEYVPTERFYVVGEAPYVLTVRCYNLDLNHSHQIIIRYGEYPVEMVFPNIEIANQLKELQYTLSSIFGGAPQRAPETTS